MLRLLIVDDEEMICQAIADIIDWKKYNIQLIGTCTDGVEAYHTILDESPDIVMTDIRMPGISGLDLIERITKTDLCTQFIILSGYGEFDYAKRAMKCGVRHYLLKPCTEDQIIDCINDVKKDCYKIISEREMESNTASCVLKTLQKSLIKNIIREGISATHVSDSFFEPYEHYMNLTNIPYEFCCIYYLEEKNLQNCLFLFQDYCKQHMPEIEVYTIYVRNTLILFFPAFTSDCSDLDRFFQTMSFRDQTVSIEYSRKPYEDLKTLLNVLIPKLKRYDILYFIEGHHTIPNFNYGHIVENINSLLPSIASSDPSIYNPAMEDLKMYLTTVSNRDFLLQLADNILISLGTQLPFYSLPEIADFLFQLHKESQTDKIVSDLLNYITSITNVQSFHSRQYSPFISKLIEYIYEHYSNPDLTLKWICENYLYMNENYVSRCFTKETGEKFSSFLMNLRIQKAKEIMAARDNEKIQNVAELVDCGNTPYYFSKIFKKCTGFTPSAYVKKMYS